MVLLEEGVDRGSGADGAGIGEREEGVDRPHLGPWCPLHPGLGQASVPASSDMAGAVSPAQGSTSGSHLEDGSGFRAPCGPPPT